MEKIYTEMWEASAPNKAAETEIRKIHGGLIIIEYARAREGRSFYTMTLNDDLFNNDDFKKISVDETAECLAHFFSKHRIKRTAKILVAGLGNDKVTADSLGANVCDKVIVTSHLYGERSVSTKFGNLSSLKCGVAGTTGIKSFDVLSSVVKNIKPDLIIAVDTLAANTSKRLGNCIQICDRGIEPGGGVNNPNSILNEESLGVPVIAVGVPLVIYLKKILIEHIETGKINIEKPLESLVITAKDIDFLIGDFSYVIAEAINKVVHENSK